MNKQEFLSDLDHKLTIIPYEERKEAMLYYQEYFSEAEDEEKAAIELGEPKIIAKQILSEFHLKEVTEMKPSVKKGVSSVWLVILSIFALPIALPLAIILVALVIVVVFVIFLLFFVFFFVAIVLLAAGTVQAIIGIPFLTVHVWSGIVAIGTGIAAVGLGMIVLLGAVELTKIGFNAITSFLKKRAERKKQNEN